MKLNIGDKVIWINSFGRVSRGKVTEIKTVDNEKITIITFDKNTILDFSNDQLDIFERGEYFDNTLKIDNQSIRNDKLEKIGI